ncbi:MAG: tRNA (adenosine(37)-N6)-threonylcarbamoyltransferase complex ATPase subunit type 1 TsaE [Acidimicrobiaceae bacterium]|nr:tRNA (adenosine(37)-N6)-threonylcarbamoyltransferase complex ATPase subunit type 1 TsaE [Acidimicrobiaceae bacterium]
MSWRRSCATALACEAAGEQFAELLVSGDVVLLSGQLGAGKTTFTKGVARGLGVKERVTSPTFTMVHEHRCHHASGIVTLHHADVYRVTSLAEVLDLAIGELVEESGVALVEWGELAASVFGRDVMTVRFEVDDDEVRTLEVSGALTIARGEAFDDWTGA